MPCSFQAQYLPPKPQHKGFFQGPLPRWIGRSLMCSRSRNNDKDSRVKRHPAEVRMENAWSGANEGQGKGRAKPRQGQRQASSKQEVCRGYATPMGGNWDR